MVLALFTFDSIAIMQLSPDSFSEAEQQTAYGELFGVIIRSVIVICYFAFSERVKKTFTKTGKQQPQPESYDFNTPEISSTQSPL